MKKKKFTKSKITKWEKGRRKWFDEELEIYKNKWEVYVRGYR